MYCIFARLIKNDYMKKRTGNIHVYEYYITWYYCITFYSKDHCFPPERIDLLRLLSQKPDIYDRLARAIAPSIYENDDIKKGILLQLFGGTKKTFVTSGRANFRAEINILLCGDPGIIITIVFQVHSEVVF